MDEITKEMCTDKAGLDTALKKYMVDVHDLEESMFPLVLSDFEDPYDCEWIIQDYLGCFDVEGKSYEVRTCYTDFTFFESFRGKESFKFYMLFDMSEIENQTVGEYMSADRLYIVDNIDPDDFPE